MKYTTESNEALRFIAESRLEKEFAEEIIAMREREKVLVDGLEKYIYSCSCHCGGFEGGEFVKQPCDRCDPLIKLLGERAALMTDNKEG